MAIALMRLRASWFAWRLPDRSLWLGDLFAQAVLLHRLGFHTAAVMTARAAMDRLLRAAVQPHVARGAKFAMRVPSGQILVRVRHLELIDADEHRPLKKVLSRLNKLCHGAECDAETAADLLGQVQDARPILESLKGRSKCLKD